MIETKNWQKILILTFKVFLITLISTNAYAVNFNDLKTIASEASKSVKNVIHDYRSSAEQTFSDGGCENIYNSIVWAGVPISRVFSTNGAIPTCSAPVGISACPLSTRIDTQDPDLQNTGSLWSRLTQGRNSFVCLNPNVVPPDFKNSLCVSANRAGKSDYGIATGTTFKRNAGQSSLNFRPDSDGRCHCAPRGYENIADFQDCSRSNPYAGWNPPDDQEPEDPQDERNMTEAEIRAQAEEAARLAEQAAACINDRFNVVASICDTASARIDSACSEQSPTNQGQAVASNAISNFRRDNESSASSQRDCFQTGTMVTGTREGVMQMRAACETAVRSCDTQCNSADVENFAMACESMIGTNTESRNLLDSKKTELTSRIATGSAKCASGQTIVGQHTRLIESLNSSARAAAVCSCRLALNNSSLVGPTNEDAASCDSIGTAEHCAQRPLDPNCFNYNAFATCARGSQGYNEVSCNCIQNSQLPGCDTAFTNPNANTANTLAAQNLVQGANLTSQGGGAGGPSSFGGNLAVARNNNSTGGSSGSGGGGGSSGSGIDLNLNNGGGEASVASNLQMSQGNKSNNGSTANSAGGSSGSGGGSGASSMATNGNASAENVEESATGLKGLFNKVVNAVGGLFGFGKKGNFKNGDLATAKKSNEEGFNANKFKPRKLRGLSSDGADEDGLILGPKSMDIWKMMNLCVNGYRCKSNIDAYIKEPNP